MVTRSFDFEWLIGPTDSHVFFSEFWEQRPLVLGREQRDYYTGLFSASEVDDLVHFTRPTFAGAHSASDPASILRGISERSREEAIGLAKLRAEVTQGKTVLIHGVQERHAKLASLCRNLEIVLRHPMNANLYLTPAGSQAFGPHYDDHDVFIVQVEGSKTWRIYEAVRDLPLRLEEETVPPARLGPAREATIHAGDLIYMPRGHVHEAFATSHNSLHLTIGVEVYRWIDLLTTALAGASRKDVRLRRALPPGLLGGAPRAQVETSQLDELLRIACERLDWPEALRRLGEEFVRRLPALPAGRLAAPIDVDQVELDTPLETAPGTICQEIDEGSSVSIIFPGNQVRGPGTISDSVHFIANTTERFTPRELPGRLSDSAKLTLVRRLLVEGLLVRARGDAA